ncbi:MAG: cation transporter [Lachnospiraceae bacterium]|nr:cation transporter [Lachnospiraceae bacterium]
MDAEKKSSRRTLLLSVLLSAPGPLILGLGLTVGRSSTQISDFTRRTAELLALIVAYVIYTVTNRREDTDANKKASLERKGNLFTGVIMCISGLCMLLLTLLSGREDKGNVVPALIVSFLGVVANTIFWRRYTVLFRREGNAILGVQARLYGAKSAVDICVTAALAAVLLFPGTRAADLIDRVGSVLVAGYMVWCGIRTIREQRTGNKEQFPKGESLL